MPAVLGAWGWKCELSTGADTCSCASPGGGSCSTSPTSAMKGFTGALACSVLPVPRSVLQQVLCEEWGSLEVQTLGGAARPLAAHPAPDLPGRSSPSFRAGSCRRPSGPHPALVLPCGAWAVPAVAWRKEWLSMLFGQCPCVGQVKMESGSTGGRLAEEGVACVLR